MTLRQAVKLSMMMISMVVIILGHIVLGRFIPNLFMLSFVKKLSVSVTFL
jgi:hypothetical protein